MKFAAPIIAFALIGSSLLAAAPPLTQEIAVTAMPKVFNDWDSAVKESTSSSRSILAVFQSLSVDPDRANLSPFADPRVNDWVASRYVVYHGPQPLGSLHFDTGPGLAAVIWKPKKPTATLINVPATAGNDQFLSALKSL